MDVSVVIPVFNGARTVGVAIRSVLDQAFAGSVEVIAVNDGSTDATAEVLESFGALITIITQANRGLAAARNAGAATARGRYLALIDDDDAWLPNKLALTTSALDQEPDTVLAYSDILPVGAQGEPLGQSPITPEFAYAPSMAELLRQWWPILPSSVVIRRAAFVQTGGFCEGFRRSYEDVDLWLRARELGEFTYIAAPLVKYRTSPIAERMERYEDDYATFRRRVRERYGGSARKLLAATQQAYVSSLGHRGLLAMQTGDRTQARRLFTRAFRYNPVSVKNNLRLLRTFLPSRIFQALSGRTARPKSPRTLV
jgi:glycosyltransferase involved in cell wall biosynthesis